MERQHHFPGIVSVPITKVSFVEFQQFLAPLIHLFADVQQTVTHEKTGLLIPVNAPTDLAAAMSRLLDHPDQARQMGIFGRQFVQRNFNQEKTLDQLEKLTGLKS